MELKKWLALCLALAFVGMGSGCGLLAENPSSSNSSQEQSESDQLTYEIEKADGKIEITITKNDYVKQISLMDVMQLLQEEEKLAYVVVDGMVTEMEGVANTANSYWMLYTDHELSNTDWGTVEYKGETYASAMFGAETMPATVGTTYLWSYETFSW